MGQPKEAAVAKLGAVVVELKNSAVEMKVVVEAVGAALADDCIDYTD